MKDGVWLVVGLVREQLVEDYVILSLKAGLAGFLVAKLADDMFIVVVAISAVDVVLISLLLFVDSALALRRGNLSLCLLVSVKAISFALLVLEVDLVLMRQPHFPRVLDGDDPFVERDHRR